jgi:hypothetical protein
MGVTSIRARRPGVRAMLGPVSALLGGMTSPATILRELTIGGSQFLKLRGAESCFLLPGYGLITKGTPVPV